jgi:hypothetical protein
MTDLPYGIWIERRCPDGTTVGHWAKIYPIYGRLARYMSWGDADAVARLMCEVEAARHPLSSFRARAKAFGPMEEDR